MSPLVILALVVAQQAAPSTCRVAVMDLENQGLSNDQAHLPKVLTEALALSVADVSGCEVITRQDIASMADFEAERQACGADVSDSCLAEIGNALGVEKIIAGSVARVGSTTTVTARLLNLQQAKVEARAEDTTTSDASLRAVAQNVGRRLFGAADVVDAGVKVPLLVTGGVVGGLGAAAAVVGGVLAYDYDQVLSSSGASTKEKDDAQSYGVASLVVAGVGGAAVVAGVVVAGLAFVME